jgi:hypothetical protein
MNVYLSQRAIEQPAGAPLPVQKAFIKQINFLVRDLKHPSLHAKKYDKTRPRIAGRRASMTTGGSTSIVGDMYRITQLISHPK